MENNIQYSDIYALAHFYRFQWEEVQQCYVLLFPEGMVKLNGGAGEVINCIDGVKTVGEIIQQLQAKFPDVPDLDKDIIGMIELAFEKSWLRKVEG